MYANINSANSATVSAASPLRTVVVDTSRQATRAPTRYAASSASMLRPERASPLPSAYAASSAGARGVLGSNAWVPSMSWRNVPSAMRTAFSIFARMAPVSAPE